jgi:Fe-S-cluster-containing dehydrogenase component
MIQNWSCVNCNVYNSTPFDAGERQTLIEMKTISSIREEKTDTKTLLVFCKQCSHPQIIRLGE